MDYTVAPLFFRIRKALRYVRLYGVQRTLVKIRGQYHMARRYTDLPKKRRKDSPVAHVGIIGCGNYSYSVISYYLKKSYGSVIRACMDIDPHHAASMADAYDACYYTTDANEVINDPDIDLIYVASNHATHAEYAIDALMAGKNVHIEKPHIVNEEQLTRLCAAMATSKGRVLSIGFNRPGSALGKRIRDLLWAEEGALMQNWFVAGHEIAPDHWYFRKEEGGRILGNLCHWTDLIYQMMPPEQRFPITITPTRTDKSDCDIAVTYTFGDGSIAAVTFSAKGHAFEGVKERYSAHRGNTLLSMDDFQRLVAEVGPSKVIRTLRTRDHGHARSIRSSYELSQDKAATGCEISYVRDAGLLFLKTRQALENNEIITLTGFDGELPVVEARSDDEAPTISGTR